MLLAVDIGNTNITIGVFKNDEIICSWRLSTKISRTEDEYGIFIKNLLRENSITITKAVISSVVVRLTEILEKALEKYTGVKALVVSHKIKTGIVLKTDNPSETGADRIANACAAAALYGVPSVVVDFGTATSFDIVNSRSEFVGGIITAGMKLQAEALGNKTSKLPKLNIEPSKKAIGTNTVDAMLSGIVRGHAAMVEGLVAQCEKELGSKTTVIATGGYSDVIGDCLNRPFDVINPELTLMGLNIIYKLNSGD